MNSKMKANRSIADATTGTKHDPTNPFCAVHPDVSERPAGAKMSDPEDSPSYRRAAIGGQRVHFSADRVTVSKKRK